MTSLEIIGYSSYLLIPVAWYAMSKCNKEIPKKISYTAGLYLSQKFKSFTMWDNFVEPMFIKQFGLLFSVGHSFIEGMTSDNSNTQHIEIEMQEMENSVKEDLNNFPQDSSMAQLD